MAIINKSTKNKFWRGCRGKRILVHCWWGCRLVQPLWKTVWNFLKTLKKIKICLLILEREEMRETLTCERNTDYHLPSTPQPGIKTTIQTNALTENHTLNIPVYKRTVQPTEPHRQGISDHLLLCSSVSCTEVMWAS